MKENDRKYLVLRLLVVAGGVGEEACLGWLEFVDG
jgi:hypothetical protein